MTLRPEELSDEAREKFEPIPGGFWEFREVQKGDSKFLGGGSWGTETSSLEKGTVPQG